MRPAALGNAVFVYGTLKKGFSNYDAVLSPGAHAYQQLTEQTSAAMPVTEEKKDSEKETSIKLCHQIYPEAWIPGLLFVDAYFCPYLVLPNKTSNKHNNDMITLSSFPIDNTGDDAPSAAFLPTVPVQGEIYKVNDSMLARLDELEGVHKGRYTRSKIKVALTPPTSSEENDGKGDTVEAFVYHLAKVPLPVVQKSESITNNGDDKDNRNLTEKWQIDNVVDPNQLPIGNENSIQFVSSYRIDEHLKYFVTPTSNKRDPMRYHPSGIYL